MDLISKEELKDYLEKNISFGGTEKKFRFYDMIDSLPSAFKGMTNKEIISEFVERDDSFAIMVDEVNGTVNIELSLDFWNSPYQKGGE